jgi:hypothetical protein
MLSSSISYWDLIKFPYFVDITESGDRGWKHAQRQGDFMDNFNKEKKKSSTCWFWPKTTIFACSANKVCLFNILHQLQQSTNLHKIKDPPHITSNWLQSHIPLGYNKVAGLVGMVWKAHVIVFNFMITHHSCLKTWNLYHFHWLHLWAGCHSSLFRT